MKFRITIVLACVGLLGCDALQKILRPEPGPQQQTVVNLNVGVQPSPSPSPTLPSCVISSISITTDEGTIFPANTTVRLDATPSGNDGLALPASCPVAPIAWSFDINTANCQFQGPIDSYNPFLRCTVNGRVIVIATIGGVLTPGRGVFTVSP